MLKTTVLPKVTVSSDEVTRQRTEITLMSYDKNVHQIKIPTDLTEGDIAKILVIFTFPSDESIIQFNGAWLDNHIQFTLPNELRGYNGNVYVEIDVDLTDDRQITFARYRLQSVVSDIDKVSNGVQTFYFELFEDFVAEVADNAQQAKDAINVLAANVETHANQAKQTMDSDVNNVRDYSVSATTTIEQAKNDALTAIDADVSAVSNLKTNALQSIADDTQSASDSLTTINGYQQTASDAVVAIDGHLANTTAKNEQVNQKYQEFDTTVSEANQNIQGILALQNDVNTLKNEAPVTNDRLVDLENRAIKQYGVRRTLNATSPLLERIGDSAGKIASVPLDDSVVQNDFDNIYPWSHIKEVIIDSEGRVHYKGEPTYETAIGDWMIEVPLYYAKDVRTETYHDEYVSAFKLPGYYTPKDFIREDGTVCQKVYYGRFKTSKEGNLDVSRPHELPSNYRHLASFRDGAKAKGDGWQEIGIDYVCDFLQRLYKIEFANLNSQAILGSGITGVRYVATDVAILSETATNRFVTTPTIASNFRVGNVVNIGTIFGANNVASMRAITAINDIDATQAEILFDGVPVNTAVDNIIVMVAQKTGQTTHLNQPSGKLSGVSGRTSIKWRGLEDPFGNLHEWIDGVLIVDNVGHLCDEPSKFSSALTSDYAPVNYVNANTNGYPLELGFDNNYPSVKFPILTGAGTTTGYADYYYQTTGLRGAFLGGHARYGSSAGLFCWFLGYVPSYSDWNVGGRLLFKPQRQIKF